MTDGLPTADSAARTEPIAKWAAGTVPLAVLMISLDEAHNMESVLANLKGFAAEVFLVDSYSSDETVSVALAHGVHVVQREFRGFGDQWNFALRELPITAPWTMKLDPDERFSDELKQNISEIIQRSDADGFTVRRRLWFMGRPLPVVQTILRGWRTGTGHFTDVLVNEHPMVRGRILNATGTLEHYDSPSLHHWFEKQNRYSTAEALSNYRGATPAVAQKLFGTPLERRMWVKSRLKHLPFRSLLIFLYCYLWQGAWRAGRVGFIWSRLRADIYRMRALKLLEMHWRSRRL